MPICLATSDAQSLTSLRTWPWHAEADSLHLKEPISRRPPALRDGLGITPPQPWGDGRWENHNKMLFEDGYGNI